MKEFKSVATFLAVVFFVTTLGVALYFASNSYEDKQIRISSNPWVGFTPFIYAQEMGWLDEKKIKFLWQVDLSENASLYERGLTHGFTATQFELKHIKDNSNLKPLFLIDRSNGADAIMSNISLDELRVYEGTIDVYLEMDSINEDFFNAFVKENKLEALKFNRINSDQQTITKLKWRYEPIVVVTYSPYIHHLLKNSILPIASTASLKNFHVIDGVYIDIRQYEGREQDFKELEDTFYRAKTVLLTDPKRFYSVIKNYLEGQTYEQFIESTHEIEWATNQNIPTLIEKLESQNIDTVLLK